MGYLYDTYKRVLEKQGEKEEKDERKLAMRFLTNTRFKVGVH